MLGQDPLANAATGSGKTAAFLLPVLQQLIERLRGTARADATGDAFTLVAPEDGAKFARIERAVESSIPRLRLDCFAYEASSDEFLEVPIGERIAAIHAKKAAD